MPNYTKKASVNGNFVTVKAMRPSNLNIGVLVDETRDGGGVLVEIQGQNTCNNPLHFVANVHVENGLASKVENGAMVVDPNDSNDMEIRIPEDDMPGTDPEDRCAIDFGEVESWR